MRLTESDLSMIVAALRVAAVQYAIDANTSRDIQRLHDAFNEQSAKAIKLADKIEQAEEVHS